MDPNATLTNLRELVRDARNPGAFTEDILDDMANAFASLDVWLSAGGYVPDAWSWIRKAKS